MFMTIAKLILKPAYLRFLQVELRQANAFG